MILEFLQSEFKTFHQYYEVQTEENSSMVAKYHNLVVGSFLICYYQSKYFIDFYIYQ